MVSKYHVFSNNVRKQTRGSVATHGHSTSYIKLQVPTPLIELRASTYFKTRLLKALVNKSQLDFYFKAFLMIALVL
jgi:hypothetical protein